MGTKRTWSYNCGTTDTSRSVTDDGHYLRHWGGDAACASKLDAKDLVDNGHLAGTLIPRINVLRALTGNNRIGLRIMYELTGGGGAPAGMTYLPILGGNTFVDWRKASNLDALILQQQNFAANLGTIIEFIDFAVPFGILGEPNFTWKPDLLNYFNGSYAPILQASKDVMKIMHTIWGNKLMGNMGGRTDVYSYPLYDWMDSQGIYLKAFRQDSFGREGIADYRGVLERQGTTFVGSGSTLAVNVASFDMMFLEVTGGGSNSDSRWENLGYSYDEHYGPGGEVERLKATSIGDMGSNLPRYTPTFHADVPAMLTTMYSHTIPGVTPVDRYTFSFTDTSTVSDSDRTIVSWLWNFGDGSTGTNRFQKNPTHTYQDAGMYNVTLQVTDDLGKTSTFGPVVANTALCPF